MFSNSSSSFNDYVTCDKCSLLLLWRQGSLNLEALLCTVDKNLIARYAPFAVVELPSIVNPVSCPSEESRGKLNVKIKQDATRQHRHKTKMKHNIM